MVTSYHGPEAAPHPLLKVAKHKVHHLEHGTGGLYIVCSVSQIAYWASQQPWHEYTQKREWTLGPARCWRWPLQWKNLHCVRLYVISGWRHGSRGQRRPSANLTPLRQWGTVLLSNRCATGQPEGNPEWYGVPVQNPDGHHLGGQEVVGPWQPRHLPESKVCQRVPPTFQVIPSGWGFGSMPELR